MSAPDPPRILLPLGSTEEFEAECEEFGCHEPIEDDKLCLRCMKRPIYGKPYSVYVCQPCYDQLVFDRG